MRPGCLVLLLLAAGVLVAVPPLVGGRERQPRPTGAVEVVEQFFAAVAGGELDRALGYVAAVPYGEEGVLLREPAIAGGWRLLTARYVDNVGLGYQTWVEVTVGDGRSRATGWVEVTHDDTGRWWLVDPLITIEVRSLGPLTYLQVNGLTMSVTDLYAADPFAAGIRYRLLPGPYRFFHRLPGLVHRRAPVQWLLPRAEPNPDPVPVSVPPLRVPEPTRAAVQRQVHAVLDQCVEYRVREPVGCPFAAGIEVGASGQDTVWRLRDISWTVIDYPTVEVHDPGGRDRELGLPVSLPDPGRVRLTATGDSDRGEPVEINVDCRIGTDVLRVLFDQAGPRVYPLVIGSLFPTIVEPTCPPEDGGPR